MGNATSAAGCLDLTVVTVGGIVVESSKFPTSTPTVPLPLTEIQFFSAKTEVETILKSSPDTLAARTQLSSGLCKMISMVPILVISFFAGTLFTTFGGVSGNGILLTFGIFFLALLVVSMYALIIFATKLKTYNEALFASVIKVTQDVVLKTLDQKYGMDDWDGEDGCCCFEVVDLSQKTGTFKIRCQTLTGERLYKHRQQQPQQQFDQPQQPYGQQQQPYDQQQQQFAQQQLPLYDQQQQQFAQQQPLQQQQFDQQQQQFAQQQQPYGQQQQQMSMAMAYAIPQPEILPTAPEKQDIM
jgi:hypothetical protein